MNDRVTIYDNASSNCEILLNIDTTIPRAYAHNYYESV